jgi:hypothetical protein
MGIGFYRFSEIIVLSLDDSLLLAWLTMAVSLANDLVPGVKRKLHTLQYRVASHRFPALKSLKRVCFMFSAPVSVPTSALRATDSLDSYR